LERFRDIYYNTNFMSKFIIGPKRRGPSRRSWARRSAAKGEADAALLRGDDGGAEPSRIGSAAAAGRHAARDAGRGASLGARAGRGLW
jgi:hypothetical protein